MVQAQAHTFQSRLKQLAELPAELAVAVDQALVVQLVVVTLVAQLQPQGMVWLVAHPELTELLETVLLDQQLLELVDLVVAADLVAVLRVQLDQTVELAEQELTDRLDKSWSSGWSRYGLCSNQRWNHQKHDRSRRRVD
jgi:hypothetical protein